MIRQSTRDYWKQANAIKGYPFIEKLHGYLYLRFPYIYIGTATGANKLGRAADRIISFIFRFFPPRPLKPGEISFPDTYHGKVIPLKTATELVSVKENVCVGDLEKVIPYQLARSIILDHPDHIVVLDCPCRASRDHHCEPVDVCLIIGEPFASFTLEHHPKKSRAITSAEAIEIIKAEDERGHVHHAFFKEAVLERFYAICNCCSCCCGAINSHKHGTPMLASSGFLAHVNEEACIGCAECTSYCSFGALSIVDGVNQVEYDKCMGCGVCVSHCEQQAIELVLTPEKGIPLEMGKILAGIN
jgi:Pyruvate/2-oxoacid:ferredoxin oxidoreductase delta subunit